MGYFLLSDNKTLAFADERMNNESVKKMWNSFTFTTGQIFLKKGKENTFLIGDISLPELKKDKEYALKVDENGIAIVGKDYGGLLRGFFSLIMKIEEDDDNLKIQTVTEESNYNISNRMLHICIFPENDLYFIKKLIRLSALCQYTHIVMEFWGILKYDCLKELSWPDAFTKEEIKGLIKECRELGVEPVPMFNQLGHATASRLCYGKNVVLDQNPCFQRLFTPDGWAWNITSEEVFSLLKKVRKELYEVFGEGNYIHIGCDEAYYITRNNKLRNELPNFLSRLTKEVEKEGRRPLMWMDMLLEKGKFKDCYGSGEKGEVENIRNSTAKSTVFVDWQYDCIETSVPSLISLKDCNRDVIGAPWFNERNYSAHIETIVKNELFGIMLTTWHTLKDRISSILDCAKKCGARSFVWSEYSGIHEETATLLRRVSFEGNTYKECGWAKEQIEV